MVLQEGMLPGSWANLDERIWCPGAAKEARREGQPDTDEQVIRILGEVERGRPIAEVVITARRFREARCIAGGPNTAAWTKPSFMVRPIYHHLEERI